MWRKSLLLTLVAMTSFALKAQYQNTYTVSDNQEFDKVKFSFNATNGQCTIEPGQDVSIMDIHNKTEHASSPRYEEKIINRTKEVKVEAAEEHTSTLGSTISRRMFSTQSVDDYTWKVYLSKLKPMDLDLNYAVGDTYIDLSDLPIERLKMKTGNANVIINYKNGLANRLQMDTFMISVDLGTFEARNLHLSRSKNIIADIGFGKVEMDFGRAKEIQTEVKASVGAGNLEIILPKEGIPVRIDVNDSPLCQIKIPKGFEKSSNNGFVTPGFDGNETNYINFSVDVAVGNIVFKNAKH